MDNVEIFIKVRKVILSCKTHEQLKNATKMAKLHVYKLPLMSAFEYAKKYQTFIQLKNEKLQNC